MNEAEMVKIGILEALTYQRIFQKSSIDQQGDWRINRNYALLVSNLLNHTTASYNPRISKGLSFSICSVWQVTQHDFYLSISWLRKSSIKFFALNPIDRSYFFHFFFQIWFFCSGQYDVISYLIVFFWIIWCWPQCD